MTYSSEDLTAAALAALRQVGPMTLSDLADVLVKAGFSYRGRILDELEYADDAFLGTLEDGRYVALDAFLDGKMLTHRLTRQEIDADIIEAATDLTPMTVLATQYDEGDEHFTIAFRRFDSELFEERGVEDVLWPPDEALVLHRGTLDGFRPGDLVVLLVANGALQLRPFTAAPNAIDLAQPLNTIVADGRPHFVDSSVWQLMQENPALFTTPVPPLGELIAASGVDRNVDQLAQAGFDFDGDRLGKLVVATADLYGLELDEARAIVAFADIVRDAGDDVDLARSLVSADAVRLEPLRADYVAHAAGQPTLDPIALDTVASGMLSVLPRRLHAAAHWFQALAALRTGRVLDAEPIFEKALEIDPTFTDALIGAARFALFRGDAARGLSLVKRMRRSPLTEAVIDELAYHFKALQPQPHPELSRNDKCWCGSGRKYKVCHLNRADVSVHGRVAAIGPKAAAIAEMTGNVGVMLILADIRADQMADFVGDFPDASEDPFVQDVSLVEGGMVADYLDAVGSISPPEDVLIAQQYMMAERSVYEIVAVDPGVGMSLRDIRTGDRVEVSERIGSRGVHVGEFYCLRVLPVGEQNELFGGIEPVVAAHRAALMDILDGDPIDPEMLVEFLGRRFAPPTLVTREGDPVVWCEATIAIVVTTPIRRKLSRRYGAADHDRWTWTEGERLLGSLELGEEGLRVQAMSEARFVELVETVLSLDLLAVVTAEQRTPAGNMAGAPVADHLEVDDPEITALLDRRVREYEVTWVDESIPALEGLTPREAAADPTRRDDVIRLLDSFPQAELPGAMSVRRLRAALGL